MRMRALYLLFLLCPLAAWADGSGADTDPAPAPDEAEAEAANDRRLPPVLPGQVVERGGKKMRVWSSSGSVSTEPAPQPPAAPQQGQSPTPSLDALGVIVDRRDR
ncbi:MAG: hypothetical protein QY326_10030 [Bdellovibrionota bacterium]|nr:MAG: hypothetical protein QY326_10030 [Bdellovibrionota bacterium]